MLRWVTIYIEKQDTDTEYLLLYPYLVKSCRDDGMQTNPFWNHNITLRINPWGVQCLMYMPEERNQRYIPLLNKQVICMSPALQTKLWTNYIASLISRVDWWNEFSFQVNDDYQVQRHTEESWNLLSWKGVTGIIKSNFWSRIAQESHHVSENIVQMLFELSRLWDKPLFSKWTYTWLIELKMSVWQFWGEPVDEK